MNEYLKVIDSLNSLEDIIKLAGETEDGETDRIEFKAICEPLDTPQSIGKAKSVIAKEMCAFLNSGGGILCWGVEKEKKTKKITIKNDSSANLEDFFDKNSKDIIKPTLSEVRVKTIDEDSGSFLVIAINGGKHIPYRVESWKNMDKDVAMRYYMRSGTSSLAMPESIVRHLYQSRMRIPNVFTVGYIDKVENGSIRIDTRIRPDESIYIKDYFSKTEVCIIRDDYVVSGFIGSIIEIPQIEAIYPAYGMYSIKNTNLQSDRYGAFVNHCNTISIKPDSYAHIRALIIKASIACDGVPLEARYSIYFLNTSQYVSEFAECSREEIVQLSKKNNIGIYKQEGLKENRIDIGKITEILERLGIENPN